MKLELESFYAKLDGTPFTERWAVMPFRGAMPVGADKINDTWQQLHQHAITKNKRLLYVHIPFCATHCSFCGFYQNPLHKHDTERYTQYLLQDILLNADSVLYQSAPIHAVYFGGGTPSALTADQLHRIITTLRKHYPLTPDCEITIEGRVLNFTDEKIDACLEAGANRFSIGVQTFDTAIRKRLARTSDKQQTINFIEKLGLRDKATVVCDLIFGLPEQTVATWQEDLAIVRDLPLDGVDLYALNLLPTTPLFKSVENNRVTLPTVTDNYQFYQMGVDTLTDYGWHQLSNSHWGKTTRERNLYNILIKQGADYLAFGSCAGGKLQDKSFMVQRNLDHYYANLDQGKKPLAMLLQGNKQLKWLHLLQGGIECGCVDLNAITSQPELLAPLINQWYQAGLICEDKLCFRLTTQGRFWASNLLSALQKLLLQINEPQLAQIATKHPHAVMMKADSAAGLARAKHSHAAQ
ncbi:anaerobic coproporphyrinogen III oxidase [Orbus hercynius]|uniref:Anaerobic coproporphyrinogen III oxidase n=1 Tax=Orbus hercynius TaxID=593135 RepID=A0A495RJM6_9GAMM|nr:heme anaerobic degradation radical SAM methyltransferase ChuW/HutW [Orbus hercynius]RKS87743.1 anaerobic coproporphyrinogen III oxidase [Orbus hercynius]